jgi:predicted NBD/HSP70 family sugar kinase
MYVGIDVGGTTIKYGFVNEKGEVSSVQSVPTPQDKKNF